MSLPLRMPPASLLRVADKVIQTFEYACVMRDFEVAEQLLLILEQMDSRSIKRFGGERRLDGMDLDAAKDRLRAARMAEVPQRSWD